MSIQGGMSNTGYPYAAQAGLTELAVEKAVKYWDGEEDLQPFFFKFLPPQPTKMGAMDFEERIMIDPMGISPLSDPQADPTLVMDYYTTAHWNCYPVKKGFQYNSMDRVHGVPELVNNRSKLMVQFNKRAMDFWIARFLFGDAVAQGMFNPSGEYALYTLATTLATPIDNPASDIMAVLDTAVDASVYQGAPDDVQPTLFVGPRGWRALVNHASLTQYAQYWDTQMIASAEGVMRAGVHGINVVKINKGYKFAPQPEGNEARAEGTFTKVTTTNLLKRFLMDDPNNEQREIAVLIFGQLGNTKFAQTDMENGGFGSGAGMVRGPEKKVINGIWTTSIEHAFCPYVVNPFAIHTIHNFCTGWQG